ncbi:hypothetical protein NLJ89_g175 [Agrocybe chaxingu]|uniref:Major facilitator superfamily (MFS) profile domain-containing protein n=1 Tax=Agrocybe chaxingu TaxID=84603 RepID=A0A9W8TGS5_9AGAR|nr:hypothetical protein NLJ89_g175 [Agrocybe chaxingu]
MADFHESNGSESPFGANGHKTRASVSGPTSAGVMDALALDARRRAALAEIDEARFSWFHAKVCLVAGIGFFTDAYDIFAISIASIMLGYVYGKDQALSKHQDLGVKVATPVGTLVGQVVFGWLADIVGRKKMYGVELLIMVVSTFAQALVGNAAAVDIIAVLIVWRFIMGVGIGGDYPLSAIISSEFAPKKTRGRMMTAVFASQGWGNFTASLVAFIITAAYRDSILAEPALDQLNSVDFMWRVLTTVDGANKLQPRPGVRGLKPWETVELNAGGKQFKVTATPCEHLPGGECIGFILEAKEFGTTDGLPNVIYFSGDTIYIDELVQIQDKYHVVVAILNLGAATVDLPNGPLQLTMDGKQGARLFRELKADVLVPMHYESWNHFKQGGEELAKAFKEEGVDDRVSWLTPGVSKKII